MMATPSNDQPERRNLLEDFMPYCERCHERKQACAWTDDEYITRYWDVPKWCSFCLETGDWERYWQEQVKLDYTKGVLQS